MLRELEAIQTIANIMSELSAGERRRVAAWLSAYAEEDAPASATSDRADSSGYAWSGIGSDGAGAGADAEPTSPMDSFEALYETVAPKTNGQKAVVAAYWLEKHDGLESWTTHNVNKQLQALGARVSSLSIVLSNEVKSKDPKVHMLEKQGGSMQARKSFALTQAGVDFVEGRM